MRSCVGCRVEHQRLVRGAPRRLLDRVDRRALVGRRRARAEHPEARGVDQEALAAGGRREERVERGAIGLRAARGVVERRMDDAVRRRGQARSLRSSTGRPSPDARRARAPAPPSRCCGRARRPGARRAPAPRAPPSRCIRSRRSEKCAWLEVPEGHLPCSGSPAPSQVGWRSRWLVEAGERKAESRGEAGAIYPRSAPAGRRR